MKRLGQGRLLTSLELLESALKTLEENQTFTADERTHEMQLAEVMLRVVENSVCNREKLGKEVPSSERERLVTAREKWKNLCS